MAFRGLDQSRTFVVLGEPDEAVALTAVGLQTLRDLRFVVEESAAVLTLLAVGAEKMLKVSMGIGALDAGDPWPDKAQMRGWGHDLNQLNFDALALYEKNLGRSTAPGYIRNLLDRCRRDTALALMLDLLTRWGARARFYRLDELAGAPQGGEPPQELWGSLESRVYDADPSLSIGMTDPEGHDAARRRVNAVLVETFTMWWTLHTRAWMTGVIGPDAAGLASALNRVSKNA